MRVAQPELLALFKRFADPKGRQAKLKSPLQLQELLDVARVLLKVRVICVWRWSVWRWCVGPG